MINKEQIQIIWDSLTIPEKHEFKYLALSKVTIPDIYVGYNKNGQRCLILDLSKHFSKKLNDIEKENLSLKFFSIEKCLCILLNDDLFNDLFDDLILSVYSKIYQVADVDEYASLFVNHFIKWSAFFENKKQNSLSVQELKGLYGELLFLKKMIIGSDMNIDDLLKTWRGPYDEVHDFISDFIDHEVKTISHSENYIRISSEYQLQPQAGKELFLVVITVIDDSENGQNIKDVIEEIRVRIYDKGGDISLFMNALLQKGITIANAKDYDVRWTPHMLYLYDCNNENFPKLTRSNIPEEISGVKYKFQLNLMDKYLADKEYFRNGNKGILKL